MKARYNVVFVGKTGTGKSALINYLYGDKIRETGVGKPVTQKGFHYVDFEINELSVRFFDSWGLEVGKEDKWLGLLNEELEKRDTGKSAEEWFHSVFYCIQGSGHRVEDSDIRIIKLFIDKNYKVAVILTKADLISEEDEEKLIDTVQNALGQGVPVIPVCSVERRSRGGIISEKFGKKDVELQAYNDFCDSIILRLPEHCVKVLEQRIDEWHEKQKKYIEKNTGRWNDKEIAEHIMTEYNFFINEEFEERNTIKQEIQHTLKLYGKFAQGLKYSPPKTNLIISLATDESDESDDDIKWWEFIWIPLGVIALPLAFPFVFIDHLISGAKYYKEAFTKLTASLVSHLKQELPEVESGIKKVLEELKEK